MIKQVSDSSKGSLRTLNTIFEAQLIILPWNLSAKLDS